MIARRTAWLWGMLIAGLGLGGCGGTPNTKQALTVDTPFMTNASCVLSDSKLGVWSLPQTPGFVLVERGNGPLKVVCQKPGYAMGETIVDQSADPIIIAHFLVNGAIGVMAAASRGEAVRYPDKITVWLRPDEWKSPSEELAWNNAKQAFDDEVKRQEEEKKKRAVSSTNCKPGTPDDSLGLCNNSRPAYAPQTTTFNKERDCEPGNRPWANPLCR